MPSLIKRHPRASRAACAALLIALLFLLNASTAHLRSASAQPGGEDPHAPAAKPRREEFVPGEVLFRYRAGEKGARASAQLTALSAGGRDIPVSVERVKGLEIVEGLRLARVPPAETLAAARALAARPEVLYAEPNYVRRKLAVPDDPRYPEQWNLKGGPGGTGGHARAEAAWDVTTGSRSVVVGIVDEGLDVEHPDLRDNVWRNPGEVPNNGFDDDGNGYADDVNGWDFFHNDRTVYDNPSGASGLNAPDAHGTHVAGIVGATGNNSQGVAGVNWQVSLMSLKILGADNEYPAPSSVLQTVSAYAYARRMREMYQGSGGALGANLRVLNNSYGGIGRSQAELDAINELGAAGILFVAAAGNDGESDDQSPSYPANYDAPNLINVAWSDSGDAISFGSNFGARTVHLAAPGTSILSTTPGGTYAHASGTSMAAPHVAGAAALACAARPDASVARLRAALLYGGDLVAAQAGKTVTGRRLNIARTLQLALADDAAAPSINDLRVVAQDGRAVTLAWTAPGDDGASGGPAQLYELRFAGQQPGDSFRLAALRPGPAGSPQTLTANVPYRRRAGTLTLSAFDDAGHAASASVPVSVEDAAAEPYAVAEGPAQPLTTGGTPLNIKFDDSNTQVGLGFDFPYFERYAQWVNVSTNGSLYLSFTPRNDAVSYVERLEGWQMIAGLWDDIDLRTCFRPDADVYLTREADRVVFRWQGVRFQSSACPASPSGEPFNFEVELRRDGTIVQRYGEGNRRGFPVVGISAGEPQTYAVASHTSEFSPADLTNAGAVTYALRRPVARANLAISEYLFNYPYPVRPGDEFEVPVTVVNNGPDRGSSVRLATAFPKEARLVSCRASQGACAVGEGNSVRADFGGLDRGATARVVYVFALGEPSSQSPSYDFTHRVSSSSYDPSSSDNESRTIVSLSAGNPTPLVGATAVSAGGTYSLALKPDGTVLAWGNNQFGQLGDGGRTFYSPQPQGVRSLAAVAAVSAGHAHALALKSSGAVWAWGDNSSGQVGDGTNAMRKTPLKVEGLANMTAVAAGGHSLAVRSDGTAWGWGPNGSGQLGDGTLTNRTRPVQVQGLSAVRSVAAGNTFSVALKTDGTVWTWGANESGQLGDGTNAQRSAPAQVPGLSGVVAVSAGRAHALALRGDGTVWAWGANNGGQLGDASFTQRRSPVQVTGLAGAAAVDCGDDVSAALRTDGTVWAWGANQYGAVGDGTGVNRFVPVRTVTIKGALAVSAGSAHVLALTGGGKVWAWGVDTYGQLGDGSTDNGRAWPYEALRQVPDPAPLGTVPTPGIDPGGGSYATPQSVRLSVAGGGLSVTRLALGAEHVLASTSDGRLHGWGNNQWGQLGFAPVPPGPGQISNGETLPRPQPYDAAQALAVTNSASYALNADGTVWTWGANNEGQLGDGTLSARTTPAQVPGLSGVVAVSAMFNNNVALKADGTVWTWGSYVYGQTGLFPVARTSPVQVAGLSGVKSVSAGYSSQFAVREDGTLWMWGNFDGTIYNFARQVPGMTNVRAAGAGDGFAVVLKQDGTVWAWGRSVPWVPSTPPFGNRVDFPQQVAGLQGVASISVAPFTVAALDADGALWMWGSNGFGQIGNGSYVGSATPWRVETLSGNIVVHYTTDGREPTDDDPALPAGGTVLVDRSMTLKARAWRDGWLPSGAASATFLITNNRVDDTQFFVSQHYRDFLGREPDAAGLQFWAGDIDSCGADFRCREVKRIHVSAAFFLSIEFQETGYLAYRARKAAFGALAGKPVPITRDEMLQDARVIGDGLVVNADGWRERLEQNKQAYFAGLAASARFGALYPATLSPEQFVDALDANAGGALSAAEREALVAGLKSNALTRAQALRAAAEDAELTRAEFNRAFVLMQYFGYLRRNPDDAPDADFGGWLFWLSKLDQFGGDFVRAEMVKAFLDSVEYRKRFEQ